MLQRHIFSMAALTAIAPCAQAQFQQDYYYLISSPSYKIILLGEWAPQDKAKWKQTLDTEGIFEYGFTLRDRESYNTTLQGLVNRDVERFERWLRQFSGINSSVRWIALGMDNRLIASGARAVGAREFTAILDQNGVDSPQKIIRAFLQKHPDHIDAKSDYLREVRRRALLRLASIPASDPGKSRDEDLGKEADLRTWGILAAEVDRIFNEQWRGLDLVFFRPEREQPEKFSPLMKASFRRHISKVESAIREAPGNAALWDIWGWMARSLDDYNRERFIKTLDAPPSAKVCAWLLDEARSKSDWNTVLELAVKARGYFKGENIPRQTWMPGGTQDNLAFMTDVVQDWPVKSAYAPQLTALLRLNRIEEANDVFDRMIRAEGVRGILSGSNNAQIAAGAARAAGMENIAVTWEKGELIKKGPHAPGLLIYPCFLIHAERTDEYFREFVAMANGLLTEIYRVSLSKDNDVPSLGWKKGNGSRWALIGEDLQVLSEGESIPSVDEMDRLLDRFNLKNIDNDIELARRHIAERPDQYEFMLDFAFKLISRNYQLIGNNAELASLSAEQDEALWGEPVSLLSRVLTNAPNLLMDLPYISKPPDGLGRSSLLKPLSTQYLKNIEMLLERKPSSQNLWRQWLFWRTAEGSDRPMGPVAERIAPSPFAMPGTVPPYFALEQYYNECRQTGAWPKVIELLMVPWEREILRIDESKFKDPDSKIKNADFGDRVGAPLIEALLNDGKIREADDIFSAWIERGGAFANPAKLIELARAKGSERLAGDWEGKVR